MKNRILIPITVVSIIVSWFIWQNSPEYIKRGGPLLVLGLTLFFLALTFAVERALVLWRAGGRGNVPAFVAQHEAGGPQRQPRRRRSRPASSRAAASPT